MISYIQPAETIETFVRGLAAHIVANSPLSIAVMKEDTPAGQYPRHDLPELFGAFRVLRVGLRQHRLPEGLLAFREEASA